MHAHSQDTSAQLIIQGHTTTMEMVLLLLLLLSQEFDKVMHKISNSGVGQRKLPIDLLRIWKHFPPWSPNKTYIIREQSYIEMQF